VTTETHHTHTSIEAVVTFAFSEKEPYHHDYPPETNVGIVKAAAMNYFEVQPDPAHEFFLTHDRVRKNDSATLASVAGEAEAVAFRLVKEIPEG
jgi:hypothetical protein